jgi:hypothetical protein
MVDKQAYVDIAFVTLNVLYENILMFGTLYVAHPVYCDIL